jgi:hypothetical protein
MRLGGAQSRFGWYREEKNFFPLLKFELQIFQPLD